jgi:acetyltransferase-like isoleucine patch superfamily enzyme
MKNAEDWSVDPIIIEDIVSIGSSVTVLCGVTIGKNSVVGAGSVVTKDIPPFQVWAGNPARFLKNVELG